MRINFVMSNTVYSGIFNDIIKQFKRYLSKKHELFVTQYPIDNVDIYHYHRPNLETELLPNSVVTVHHDLEDTDPWFDATTFLSKYYQADKIICLNKKQQYLLEKISNITNTVLIPHGVDDRLFTQKTKSPYVGKIIFGVISKRYGRRVKGEALLSELYKRLNVDKVSFCFIGDNRTTDMYEAQNFGFGAVAYENIPYAMYNELYKHIDILLVPSLFEGGPASIPEALYTKTPIIGRKIAMIADMVQEGINGYYLTGDPDSDAALLNNLAENKNNIFTDLVNNTYDNAFHVITWKEVVYKHIKVYEDVIKETADISIKNIDK
jgi:glycosyltransferase involved in cell wall biosynthesis